MDRRKRLLKYILPSIMSSAMGFIMTLADSIILGQCYGENALGAVNLTLPVVTAISSLFSLASFGGAALISIRLGEGDKDGANHAFMQMVVIVGVVGLALSVLGTVFAGPIARALRASDTFYEMTSEYMFCYSLFLIPIGMARALHCACRSDSVPGLVSIAVVAGNIFNIVADYILVFPLHMGVKGAAIATGVSQILACLIVMPHFVKKRGALRFGRFEFNLGEELVIFLRGASSAAIEFAIPIFTFCMNTVLAKHVGDIGINAFSVISAVASLSLVIFTGCSLGMQPLFGESYGEGDRASLRWYLRTGVLINLVGSVAITLITMIFSTPICAAFGFGGEQLSYTAGALPQFSWAYILASISMVMTVYLYSTSGEKSAIVIAGLHSFVTAPLAIFGLPALFGSGIIWFAMGINEIFIFALAVFLLLRNLSKYRKTA